MENQRIGTKTTFEWAHKKWKLIGCEKWTDSDVRDERTKNGDKKEIPMNENKRNRNWNWNERKRKYKIRTNGYRPQDPTATEINSRN